MSHFLREEAILEELEAEYESSCSETEDIENVSIHDTDSEEDANPFDHQSHELSPLVQPLGVRNWRDLQVSHDYLDVPLQFLRCGSSRAKIILQNGKFVRHHKMLGHQTSYDV
ncbi:unnamed protein product [Parnassius apollo]|uniref:(apollo) hypothetical protein n=1 Tax=Parnassius apollo TaxID=110799 RepID=A0A8S3WM45_PARAO|nr:unnamed protein product [Parnassius apollo]